MSKIPIRHPSAFKANNNRSVSMPTSGKLTVEQLKSSPTTPAPTCGPWAGLGCEQEGWYIEGASLDTFPESIG